MARSGLPDNRHDRKEREQGHQRRETRMPGAAAATARIGVHMGDESLRPIHSQRALARTETIPIRPR